MKIEALKTLVAKITTKLSANGVKHDSVTGVSLYGPFARITVEKVALIRFSSQEKRDIVEIHWDQNNQINAHEVTIRQIRTSDFVARLVRDMTKKQRETFRLQGVK